MCLIFFFFFFHFLSLLNYKTPSPSKCNRVKEATTIRNQLKLTHYSTIWFWLGCCFFILFRSHSCNFGLCKLFMLCSNRRIIDDQTRIIQFNCNQIMHRTQKIKIYSNSGTRCNHWLLYFTFETARDQYRKLYVHKWNMQNIMQSQAISSSAVALIQLSLLVLLLLLLLQSRSTMHLEHIAPLLYADNHV